MSSAFDLHRDFEHEVVPIGAEGQPVIRIDNLLADPETLVDYAARTHFSGVAKGYYPGVRAALPLGYLPAIHAHLKDLVLRTFGAPDDGVEISEGNFSLVTTRPENLVLQQRLPHVDAVDPNVIAVLHYLCGEGKGGTCFFRHRATGLESVSTQPQWRALLQALDAECARSMPTLSYVRDSTDTFERIAAFDAVFNRMLIYRGASLHSGSIPADFGFEPDVRKGRLTANTFFRLRKRT